VSTISRAVAGKHVATPGGLRALREFFVGTVATSEGGMSAGENSTAAEGAGRR
jgi:DNA-directed RNA polymerase specialized sigma54-like protein